MPSRLASLNDPTPHARLLSNGRYTVLLSGAGTGYSRWNDYALTWWSADRTEDRHGLFLYLRDLDRGALWSFGYQPVAARAVTYDATYEAGRMSIQRVDGAIEAHMDVCVTPDDDLEVRRLHLRNLSPETRRIEITTYAEVVLNDPAAHAAHPAFSKLFVETESVPQEGVLLAHRRPRSAHETHPWMMHALIGAGALQCETDRARFIGRGRSVAAPAALVSAATLSGATGSVLDPIFSLRRFVELPPGQSVQLTLLLGVAPTRAAVLDCAARYRDQAMLDEIFARAGEHERAQLRRLGIADDRAEYFQALAGAMLYGDPALRADAEVLRRAHGGISGLHKYGVDGGSLFFVAEVESIDQRAAILDLAKAVTYWRTKALSVRGLVVCEECTSLVDELRRVLAEPTGSAAAIVVRPRTEIPPADLDLIRAAADLVVHGALPAFNYERAASFESGADRAPAVRAGDDEVAPSSAAPLQFSNDCGGFSAEGNEYIIHLEPGSRPPMPWINVVANETFGFLVSESGAGYTWSRNSRKHRLTPWSNDPITDPYGEALYIRDEDTGAVWSPLPGPVAAGAPHEVRHGFGYTQWSHVSAALEQRVVQFVPRFDSVKVTRLRVTNTSRRPRRLSLFAYHRLVLGPLAEGSARGVVTERDADSGAILAYNRLDEDFGNSVVFAAAVPPEGAEPVRCTGDRATFIGRNGSTAAPAALTAASQLDGRLGAGLDPCACLQVTLRVAPGATVECAFLLGEASDTASARAIVGCYRRPMKLDSALDEVREFWRSTLSAVRVETPSSAIDLMLNGWLLYQTVSCRLWGRSAFYQSGGAFGFRDQLQDAAALVHARPDLTRAQILLHAAHQFVEGDVLHWWHPPAGRGIRTRFSDDLLWLPYVTAVYMRATGDCTVLGESVGFLTARALEAGEDEAYLLPAVSDERADVYAHCCRALDRSLTRGAHGLPLMGTGDWNDGMNRVGREGRGESVWLGFFLYHILDEFIPYCVGRGDAERAQRYRAYQAELKVALNDAGWDGAWYRRAYYDDGTPLGSAQNAECRIDALAQAWAVISKAAPPERAAQAMDAVEEQLVVRDAGLIRLLTPPFDHEPHDPGYIKGYVPGIRENGGQYTHAALWVVQALAELGRRDRAAPCLEMLTPIAHSRGPEQVGVYQLEPYVIAADIYGVAPHVGRGGWSWYTGSAGWMYRIALESVLGLRVEGGSMLRLRPCVPDDWPQFTVHYRLPDGKTQYEIEVRNPAGDASAVTSVSIDDTPGRIEDSAACIPLVQDGAAHRVGSALGAASLRLRGEG